MLALPGVQPRAEDSAAALPRDSGDAAVIRGSIAFRTYCVLCHGASGKGDGRAAKMYTPRPANLTVSPFNDKYKEMIIRGGGASVGRSASCRPGAKNSPKSRSPTWWPSCASCARRESALKRP